MMLWDWHTLEVSLIALYSHHYKSQHNGCYQGMACMVMPWHRACPSLTAFRHCRHPAQRRRGTGRSMDTGEITRVGTAFYPAGEKGDGNGKALGAGLTGP